MTNVVIVDAVRTPIGKRNGGLATLHPGEVLAKVDEARQLTTDGGKAAGMLLARNILRERKMDEAYQDWLRQERDRAYVELRLDEQ